MNRGRSNNSRGRSASRGRGSRRGRNFGNESTERTEQAKLDATRKEIEDKKTEAANAVNPNPQATAQLVTKGATWISHHFRGFQKEEHGNIRVKLNEDIDIQLYELYESKIKNIISKSIADEDTLEAAGRFLRPLIGTCIGIKLLKANTISNRATTLAFRGIEGLEFKLPKKLATIINSVGKTDAINDNVVRLKYQNLVAKRYIFKGLIDYFGYDKKYWNRNLWAQNNAGYDDWNNYRNYFVRSDYFKNHYKFYDLTSDGAAYVNESGRKYIRELLNTEFGMFQSTTRLFNCRLPNLSEKDFEDLDAIKIWLDKVEKFIAFVKNADGTDIDDFKLIVSQVMLAYIPLRWLQSLKKTFGELAPELSDTMLKEVTVKDCLTHANYILIDDIMNQDDIANNVLILYKTFKSKIEPIYDEIFDNGEFIPTDYGSPAQTVYGHEMKDVYPLDEGYDLIKVVNKNVANTFIKMSESEALIGASIKLCDSVNYASNYRVLYEGSTSEIRLDYLASDFKH